MLRLCNQAMTALGERERCIDVIELRQSTASYQHWRANSDSGTLRHLGGAIKLPERNLHHSHKITHQIMWAGCFA